MAKSTSSLELFKDLPKPMRASGGKPKEDGDEEQSPLENEPKEFPLGEHEIDAPVFEEELPPPIAPPESDTHDAPDNDVPLASNAAARMTHIEMLKNRAMLMGIKFSNNIGLEALQAKIQSRLDGETSKDVKTQEAADEQPDVPVKSERQVMYEREMRLVRLRITNLDPKKKDLPGEIFTVANEMLGAVKKYIPYGEATDNGYHVPYIIYRQLKEREFLNIKTRKDRQGRVIVESSMAREFALEELPQLTQKELNQLAAQQAASAGIS